MTNRELIKQFKKEFPFIVSVNVLRKSNKVKFKSLKDTPPEDIATAKAWLTEVVSSSSIEPNPPSFVPISAKGELGPTINPCDDIESEEKND